MAFRGWSEEVAFTLVTELEAKLSPIGYHVATQRGRRMATLELFVFPAIQEKDRGGVADVLRSNDLRLIEKKSLERAKKFGQLTCKEKEVWGHGRGKSEKRIEVFLQKA